MTAIPDVKKETLKTETAAVLTATQAVRQGIATHAQKHIAERHAAHAKLEETRKLAASAKPKTG